MGGDEDVRSWSDAPEDILTLILSKLYPGDTAAFYAVCKIWSKVPRVKRILSDEELCSCACLIFPNKRFFHPLTNTWFQMNTTQALPRGFIVAQNYGWLLMNLHQKPIFFFNPFTGDRIDLPTKLFEKVANFSTPPTSPDCEIFTFLRHKQIVVQTIKRGEDEFSTKDVCDDDGFESPRRKTVFFKGEYYCLGKEGNLVIYNPAENKYRRTDSAIHMWDHFFAYDCGQYLLEGEGDLWAVFIALQGKKVFVCKLNLNIMIWEIVHDLGDRMIFLSSESCLMERTKVRGAGNKIYLPKLMGGYCLFYSLKTKRYHTYARTLSHDNSCDNYESSYESFVGSKDMLRCTWIHMSTCLHSQSRGKELSW